MAPGIFQGELEKDVLEKGDVKMQIIKQAPIKKLRKSASGVFLADDGLRVADTAIPALKKLPKLKLQWQLSVDHVPEVREFVKVAFEKLKGQLFLVDAVTGGLYDIDTGRHLIVSTMRIVDVDKLNRISKLKGRNEHHQ